MKYINLQQAHNLVDGYSQEEKDVLKPFLPELPEQKTLREIIKDVYEAYMNEPEPENSDRLDEIHFQLVNLADELSARESVLYLEDYEELPEGSVVLAGGQGLPWIKRGRSWHSATMEVRSNKDMSGVPRKVIREGQGDVR